MFVARHFSAESGEEKIAGVCDDKYDTSNPSSIDRKCELARLTGRTIE